MICNFCELKCNLSHGAACGAYIEKNGEILEKFPFSWTTYRTALSEDIPVFHFYPRRKVMEVGGLRCNAACGYCINARVVDKSSSEKGLVELNAEQFVHIAQKTNCTGIHFGINEVTTNLISALETAKVAKTVPGFVIGACTNGYMTEYAADEIAKYFDYLNISLKSASAAYYKENIGLPDVNVVKRNIAFFAKRLHVEITVPVVQGVNDHELPKIADFLASIDPEIPLHVFRLQPMHKMEDKTPPNVFELSDKVLEIRKTLPYTYFSNFIGSTLDNTVCPDCGEILIRRLCVKPCGATLTDYNITPYKKCPVCGKSIKIIGDPDKSVRR